MCDGCHVDGAIKLRNSLLVRACIKTLDLNVATGVGINNGDSLIAAIGSAMRKLRQDFRLVIKSNFYIIHFMTVFDNVAVHG